LWRPKQKLIPTIFSEILRAFPQEIIDYPHCLITRLIVIQNKATG
jgi:hypothetical protein